MIALIILLSLSVGHAIPISGDIWGVLGPENSPYDVVGDLRVPKESTLIILPGCYLNFAGHYMLKVDTNATLTAEGTESDSIYFTTEDTATGWFGIRYYNADSSCRLSYCILEWGRATSYPSDLGGAIYMGGTTLAIENCRLRYNRSYDGRGRGGAIAMQNSTVQLRNSQLTDNACSFGGAAIYAEASHIYIHNSDILNNVTWYILGGELGGGITAFDCPEILIEGCLIRNNYSGQMGGGLIAGSNIAISNNIISFNRSYDSGAGLFIGGSFALIANNLIFENSGMDAGGLLGHASHLTLINNTIVLNHSRGLVGGFFSAHDTATVLRNNIIWGNTSYWGHQIYAEQETIAVAEYNDIQGGWPGVGNIDADPLFADTANGDFHLTWTGYPANDSSKSPCIDTGDPSSPLDPDTTRADIGALFFDRRLMAIAEPQPLSEGSWRPDIFSLRNYPNPFNSSTVLRYALPAPSPVTIDIYDILGRKLLTLADGIQPAGSHQLLWDASEVPSGVYFYRLQAGGKTQTRKCMLVK